MVKPLQKLGALVLLCYGLTGSSSAWAQSVINSYPYHQEFNDCVSSADPLSGGWERVSRDQAGTATWGCSSYGYNGSNALEINGYNKGQNEDWLISPAFDLTGQPKPQLSFWTKSKYAGPALKLMVSTTYDGSGTINPADWTELAADFPAVNSDTWTQTKLLLDAYAGATVYVAFVYTSAADGTDAASRWTVDDVAMTDVSRLLTTDNVVLDFGAVAVGAMSEAKAFTFRAEGYGQDVVVSVPENFELSKDGATYQQSLTYTAAAAAEQNTVFVRFKPLAEDPVVQVAITFQSGTQLDEQRGALSGTSILREQTLDIATWNMEWFGVTGNGPSDEQLQYNNAKQVLSGLHADIIALQEVSSDAQIRKLAQELSYSYENMQMPWQTFDDYQQVYFLYKPEVVTVKKEKVLLAQLYQDIRSGKTTLANYPGSSSSFWASGRLPYLVQFEANIDGVRQVLNVVDIHAKANSGSDLSPYDRRKYDVQVLKDSLDAYYGTTNLVILGDYNDDVYKSVVGTDNPSSYAAFVTDPAYKTLTYELSEAGAYDYESGSTRSFLDHIIVSKSLVDDYVENSISIETRYLNSIDNYRTTTSDHLPVSARFALNAVPSLSFATAEVTKSEDAGTFEVTMTASAAPATDQTATIAVAAGATATPDDYTLGGMENNRLVLTLPAGATSVSFQLTVVDDTADEPEEEATFRISDTSADLVPGDQDTFHLTLTDNDEATTGIADATEGQFRLYPNPAQAAVNLLLPEKVAKLQDIRLSVWSVEGRQLYRASGSLQRIQGQLNARLPRLTSGVYILKLEAADQIFQCRLMKQ